jgi:hypothetical protein
LPIINTTAATRRYGVPRAEVDTSGLLKRELEIG